MTLVYDLSHRGCDVRPGKTDGTVSDSATG